MIGREKRVLLRHYLEQGMTKAAIARQVAVSRDTIYRWIRTGQLDRDLDEEAVRYGPRPRRPSKLDPYKGIIDARLADQYASHEAPLEVSPPRWGKRHWPLACWSDGLASAYPMIRLVHLPGNRISAGVGRGYATGLPMTPWGQMQARLLPPSVVYLSSCHPTIPLPSGVAPL